LLTSALIILKADGMDVDKIEKYTSLTAEEIEAL
jgi:hypothetical protein